MTPMSKLEGDHFHSPELTFFRNTKVGNGVRVMGFTNIYDCDLGDECFVGPFVEMGGVLLGRGSRISSHSYLCPGVQIGEECFIGHGCMFTNDLYTDVLSYSKLSDLTGKWKMRPTIIGNRVRIGSGAVILPVRIGDDVIIGCGAVVTKDVESGTTVDGVPARLKYKHLHNEEYR